MSESFSLLLDLVRGYERLSADQRDKRALQDHIGNRLIFLLLELILLLLCLDGLFHSEGLDESLLSKLIVHLGKAT